MSLDEYLTVDPATRLVVTRRRPRWRPGNGTAFMARALAVRAVRAAGAHHLLRGRPAIVGLLLEHEDDAPSLALQAAELLRATETPKRRGDWRVANWCAARKRLAMTWEELIADDGDNAVRIVALAPASEGLPLGFVACADGVATIGRPDAELARAAFLAVAGADPGPLPSNEALARVPIGAHARILRRGGGGAKRAAVKLRKLADALSVPAPGTPEIISGPRLDDLHGLGEAADWGRALARDLEDYRAGRLPWSDVDRGVLVSGPPGTGKTTFALALGRTAGVPVHVHSLAAWQSRGYLNDLLKAMRGAFAAAMEDAPCILFLDEIDSFGDRETFAGHSAAYQREVVNALLECLDGAGGREGVVVVGATNHPNAIDAGIRRPGRLDRHVVIPLPDRPARVGILRHHLRGALASDDLHAVAERMGGATGAAIEQSVRDARRRAREERRPMELRDLEACVPASTILTAEAFRRGCVHEAGHAVVGTLLEAECGSAVVSTSVRREVVGVEAGQTTFRRVRGFDRTLASYLADVTVQLAGLAAERVLLGSVGDGGGGTDSSDLATATRLAAECEVSVGLGGGLVYLAEVGSREVWTLLRLDPLLRRRVDEALGVCMDRAVALLEANCGALEAVAQGLDRDGEVTGEAVQEAVSGIRFKDRRNAAGRRKGSVDDVRESPPAAAPAGLDSLRAPRVASAPPEEPAPS